MARAADRERIERLLEKLPAESGVYIMRGQDGAVLYVGKAVNLRARVRSYFRKKGDGRYFVRLLPGLLEDIEVIITPGEQDALILERRLVQRYRPRFNIDLQDDKSFLSIALGGGPFPRLMLVRRRPRSGEELRWFGPYTSAAAARETFRLIQQAFGLRTCPDRAMKNRSRPCLLHGMGRCRAPCVGLVDQEQYALAVKSAVAFLRGDRAQVLEGLRERMLQAARNEEFELAARLRDRLRAVERALAEQPVIDAARSDLDVVGSFREGRRGVVVILHVRSGCLLGISRLPFQDEGGLEEEGLRQALARHFLSGADVPARLLLPPAEDESEAAETEALAGWLSGLRGSRVTIGRRGRGPERSLLQMARQNAEEYFRQRLDESVRRQERLARLQKRLVLDRLPRHIECVDLSTLQGGQSVGALTVMVDGEPQPSEYRRFRIKRSTVDNDLAMMQEVVERRLRRLKEEGKAFPDLLLLDGGYTHLQAVEKILRQNGWKVELAAIAKGRYRRRRGGQAVDEFYRPGRKNPLVLRPQDDELMLLVRLRDEAHRFALAYHRRLRLRERLGQLHE
jgi:excinuclease ABC subunit C